jgi:hypothetical protein
MDPWLLLASGACLAAHVLEGRAGEPALVQVAERVRGAEAFGAGFTDRPVLGSLLVGVGTWRVAVAPQHPSGLELLALADRIGSRQDVPAFERGQHRELAVARYGADVVARAYERAAALPADAETARAVALLRGGTDLDGTAAG